MDELLRRPLEPADLQFIQQWLNDEDTYKNLYNLYRPLSLWQLQEWYEKERDDGAYLCIYHNPNEAVALGMIHYLHPKNRCGEICLIVSPDFRMQGYGSWILRDLERFSFCVLNLHKLFFHTASYNPTMSSLALKLGYLQEGLYRKELYYNGSYHDILRFGKLYEEFFTSKDGQT